VKLSDTTIRIRSPGPTRLLVQAFADMIRPGPVPLWTAYAWSAEPDAHRRTYDIEAKTEGEAAQEAIRRLVEEVECLGDGE
jgi:hypothetical protein